MRMINYRETRNINLNKNEGSSQWTAWCFWLLTEIRRIAVSRNENYHLITCGFDLLDTAKLRKVVRSILHYGICDQRSRSLQWDIKSMSSIREIIYQSYIFYCKYNFLRTSQTSVCKPKWLRRWITIIIVKWVLSTYLQK